MGQTDAISSQSTTLVWLQAFTSTETGCTSETENIICFLDVTHKKGRQMLKRGVLGVALQNTANGGCGVRDTSLFYLGLEPDLS